jgi:hypothetical protein
MHEFMTLLRVDERTLPTFQGGASPASTAREQRGWRKKKFYQHSNPATPLEFFAKNHQKVTPR